MNVYRNYLGQSKQTDALEIFQCNSINGARDWHVSGVESDSYRIGTFENPSDGQLLKAAEKVIRRKYDFIGDIEMTIRR